MNLNKELKKLTKHDRREIKLFVRFLKLKEKHGFEKLAKRPFWRKYLGLDEK
jgi:hypothetical protein